MCMVKQVKAGFFERKFQSVSNYSFSQFHPFIINMRSLSVQTNNVCIHVVVKSILISACR